jgi:predicted nucleic acid-binding Zn ribbon protein
MNEDEQFSNAVKWRKKPDPNVTARLGDAVKQLMEDWISPQQSKLGQVAELWDELLPAELRRHCRLDDVSGGQLKVLADSSSYLYELQLCSLELLKELQRRCPRAGIKKIKPVLG